MDTKHLGFACALVLVSVTVGCSKEAKLERHRARGQVLFSQGDYEGARIEYLNAVRIDGGDFESIFRLGIIHQDQGAPLSAAPFLNRARELNPGNAEVRARLALLLRAAGESARAREEAMGALNLNPSQEDAVILLAEWTGDETGSKEVRSQLLEARTRAGDGPIFDVADAIQALGRREFEAAEAQVGAALQKDPRFAAAHSVRGMLFLARSNMVGAEESFRTAAALSPARSARRMWWAEFLRRKGDRAQARETLERMVKETPDYLPPKAMLGEMAFEDERFEEALEHLNSVLAQYRMHLDALLLRSRILLIRNEFRKVIEELELAARLYGAVPELRYLLAVAHAGSGDIAKALGSLNLALESDGRHSDSRLLRARINLSKGSTDDALRDLVVLREDKPQDEQSTLLYAEALEIKGVPEEALRVYQQYANNSPEDPRGPYWLGLWSLRHGRADEAAEWLRAALKLQPDYVPALERLVEAELRIGNHREAMTLATESVRKNPASVPASLQLARVHIAAGEVADAVRILRRIISAEPDHVQAYVLLAECHRERGDAQNALQELSLALEKDPEDLSALLMQAAMLSELKRFDEAVEAYHRALSVDPDCSPALNNLAYLLADQLGKAGEAWTYARRARELMPYSPQTADTLGWVHFRKGEFPEALRLFQDAARELPGDVEVQLHLGATFYMLGDQESASTFLKSAARSSEPSGVQAEARRYLELLNATGKSDPRDSIKLLENRVKEEPRDTFAWVNLGRAHEKTGARSRARECYEAAIKVSPGHVEATISLAELSSALREACDEALRLARRARELAGGNGQIAWRAGRVAMSCKEPAVAYACFHDGVRALSDAPGVAVDLSKASFALGRFEEAEASAARALDLDSKDLTVADLVKLIQVARVGPNQPEGAESLIRLKAGYPDDLVVVFAEARYHESRGELGQSIGLYERLLKDWPQLAPAHQRLALIYWNSLKDEQKAFFHAAKARESLKDDPEVARLLGILAQKRGDSRYAAQLLMEAAASLPADSELYFHLGAAQLRSRQEAQGTANLRRVMEMSPASPIAREAEALIGASKKR